MRGKNLTREDSWTKLDVVCKAVGFEGDVRKQEDAERVVESTFKHFGRIDILVNAAAGNFLVSAEDLSPNGFRTVLDIESVGTFTMCREALKYLKKGGEGRSNSSGGGSIINISATLHYTASWYQIHVSAAKAAVDATTRNLALEWGTDYDIRVNGIAPGPISDTPGMSKLAPDEISSKARDYMPLYKLGEKWDIAMTALFLASDAGWSLCLFTQIIVLILLHAFIWAIKCFCIY
ncbi:peroxisomal 2,4-dienoyl-CoA reductase [(3E)-enoyl-CoA-producing]-like [Vigna umbellata]|uniref:peroxisomal 2,4-dienoyl-CoA reductase [(3E)-enoyl-CoA-producing]-like n=1 Tax=Vigna umbellata TaxID=87088 RepID=UPI001F5FBF51|nr:peroxisomal 2,4-dienoyl-CoA reductase [(3E)-enoyl-CoA-producing]-like [Vigna umbellata]